MYAVPLSHLFTPSLSLQPEVPMLFHKVTENVDPMCLFDLSIIFHHQSDHRPPELEKNQLTKHYSIFD